MVVFGFSKNGQKSAGAGAEEFASDGTGSSGAVVDGIDSVIADLVGEGTFVEPSLVEIGNLGLGNFRSYAGEAGKEKHEVVFQFGLTLNESFG